MVARPLTRAVGKGSREGRPGADSLLAGARGRSTYAPRGGPVLGWRVDRRPKHVAAMDDRSQSAPAGRQTPLALYRWEQRPLHHRNAICHRGKSEEIYRSDSSGWYSPQLLVDGCRLVSLYCGRVENRNVDSGWEEVPQRAESSCRLRSWENLKVILWFEPERVTQGSWLDQHHPEWLLGPDGKDKLLDLGNPEAWHWLVDHVSGIIADMGLDVYRQDFNFPPLQIWRAQDAPDRQGIT